MKVQRAKYELMTARLNTEFGEQMAARWFTADQLALVPRLTAGKNKGKMRGIIQWKRVSEGGWQRTNAGGGVVKPGTRDVSIIWSVRSCGMTREHCMPSRGRTEDEAAAEINRKAAIGAALFSSLG